MMADRFVNSDLAVRLTPGGDAGRLPAGIRAPSRTVKLRLHRLTRDFASGPSAASRDFSVLSPPVQPVVGTVGMPIPREAKLASITLSKIGSKTVIITALASSPPPASNTGRRVGM